MSHNGHLGPCHPVAAVVRRLCRTHLGWHAGANVGGVGCGACWERAIRDDERAAVLFGLPRDVEVDPHLIDEIAVDLACRSEAVSLTPAELAVAVGRLTAWGLPVPEMAVRLRVGEGVIRRIRAAQRAAAADPGAPDPDGLAA